MASTADVPLLITSDNARSERRISPAWTIAQLKSRLEPITGIPASSQRLTLKVASWPDQNLQGVNEDNIQLGAFTLQSYAELHVSNHFFYVSPHLPSKHCRSSYMMWHPLCMVRWASVALSLGPPIRHPPEPSRTRLFLHDTELVR